MASITVLQPQTEQSIADILQNAFNNLPTYINRLAETNNLTESEAFKLFQDTVVSSLSNVTETPLLTYLKKNEEIINLESEIRFIKQIYASEYNEHARKYREWNEKYLKCNDNLAIMRNELTAAKESLQFVREQNDKAAKQQMDNLKSKIDDLTRNVNRTDMEKTKLKMDLDKARTDLDKSNQQLRDFDIQHSNSLQELFKLLPQTQFEMPLNIQEMSERLRKHLENSIRLQNTIDSLQNDLRKVSESNSQCEKQSNSFRTVSNELSELQTQYEYMKNVNLDLERQITECRLYNKRLLNDNQKLINENNKLAETHNSLDVENQNLNIKLNALQNALDQYTAQYNTHSITENEIKNLTTEIVNLNDQKVELLRQLDESRKSHEELQKQVDTNNKLIAQYNQRYNNLQNDFEAADTNRKTLETAHNESLVIQDMLQTKQSDLEKQLNDTTNKLDYVQSERNDLRMQLLKQQEYIEKLTDQQNDDMNKINTINIDDSNDETIARLTDDVRKKNEFIAVLQQKLTHEINQKTEELNTSDEIHTKLVEVNEDLRKKNIALTEQLSVLNASYKELLQVNDNLNVRCQNLSNNVDVDETINVLANDRQQLIDTHNQTIDTIKKTHNETIDELEAKIEKLNTEQRNFEEELSKKDALYKSLLEKFYRAKNLYDTTSDVDKIFSVLFRDEPNTIIQTILPFKMFTDSQDSTSSTTSKLPLTPRAIDYESTTSYVIQSPNSYASSSRISAKRKLPDSTINSHDNDSKIMKTTSDIFDSEDVDDSKNLKPFMDEITLSSCKTVSDADRSERICNIMQGTRHSSSDMADDTSLGTETDTQTFDSYDRRNSSTSNISISEYNTQETNDNQTTDMQINVGSEYLPISISSDSNANN